MHSPLKPSKDFIGASKKGKYGDFIKELDHSTGRIMKAIRDAGLDESTLVAALRRRMKPTGNWRKDNVTTCWIDLYRSTNNGSSWEYQTKVAETGINSGNPPAMVRLENGYLVVVYGVRLVPPLTGGTSRMAAKVSVYAWSDGPDENHFHYTHFTVDGS